MWENNYQHIFIKRLHKTIPWLPGSLYQPVKIIFCVYNYQKYYSAIAEINKPKVSQNWDFLALFDAFWEASAEEDFCDQIVSTTGDRESRGSYLVAKSGWNKGFQANEHALNWVMFLDSS